MVSDEIGTSETTKEKIIILSIRNANTSVGELQSGKSGLLTQNKSIHLKISNNNKKGQCPCRISSEYCVEEQRHFISRT